MSHLTVTPSIKPTGLMRRHPSLRAPDRSPYTLPLPEGVQVEVRYLQPTAFIVNHRSPHQHQLPHHSHVQDVTDRSGARISPLPEEEVQRVRSPLHEMGNDNERYGQQEQDDEEEAYRAYHEEERVLARMDPFGRSGERTPVVGQDVHGQLKQRGVDGVQSPIPIHALGGSASLVGVGAGRPQAFFPRGNQGARRAQGEVGLGGEDGTGREGNAEQGFQFQRARCSGVNDVAIARRDSMEEMPPPTGAHLEKDIEESHDQKTHTTSQISTQPLFRPRSGMGCAFAPTAQHSQPQMPHVNPIINTDNTQAQQNVHTQSPHQQQFFTPQQKQVQFRKTQDAEQTPPTNNNLQVPQRPARPTAAPQRGQDPSFAPENAHCENSKPLAENHTDNKWVRGNLQALVFDNDEGADLDGTVVGTLRKRATEDGEERESVFNFTPNAKFGDDKIKAAPRFVIPKNFEDHMSLLKGINPQEIWRERIKAAKEFTHQGQWSDPEQMIDNQRKRFDEAKHNFDSFLYRLESLTFTMNEVIQRKTALTERYGEAGEQLSEQCVELQLATRSTAVKRRRVGE